MFEYQNKVNSWMYSCFSPEIVRDPVERNFRFLEEALELVQALDMPKEDALKVVEYVYGRKRGTPSEELRGTLVTLIALANAHNLDMIRELDQELLEIDTPEMKQKIKEKQKTKPIRGLY